MLNNSDQGTHFCNQVVLPRLFNALVDQLLLESISVKRFTLQLLNVVVNIGDEVLLEPLILNHQFFETFLKLAVGYGEELSIAALILLKSIFDKFDGIDSGTLNNHARNVVETSSTIMELFEKIQDQASQEGYHLITEVIREYLEFTEDD